MRSWLAATLLVTLSSAAGCVDDADGIEDGADDAFTSADGKADAYKLTEAEAVAVLALADGSTQAQLHDDVGLSSRIAKNVYAYVAGPDGRRGTADDQALESLEELDAIPYVGPAALAALVDHAKTEHLVKDGTLGRHDVSVLFPLPPASTDLLWKAFTPAKGGALLPKATFAKIGMGLFQGVDDAAEYDALRVVGMRVDPCFRTSLTAACQPQLRLVFQTIGANGTNDGAVHALYNLSATELGQVVDGLRAIQPAEHRAYRPLGVSPALAKQGVDGTYGTALRDLVVAHAGTANLARMTFMSRTDSRESSWKFGGFHVQANTETGFPAPGAIKIIGSTQTIQTVANAGFGSGFNYSVTPGFADAAGRDASSSFGIAALSATAKKTVRDWAIRQESPAANVPDTTDCASCHVAGHVSRVLEAADPKLATADRGPRAITTAETASDNLRAFGYFFKDAHVSMRTANETAAVVRALAR